MLEIKDLTIQYGSAAPAVAHFNLSMQPGEILAIVGESGSGKTSVIRAVMGLLPHSGFAARGDILFEGRSILSLNEEELRILCGTQISMIFQDSGMMINPIRRIGPQYVEYIRMHEASTKKQAYGKAVHMLGQMRLPDSDNIMESYPFQLSGGMRQRVGIAMAMTFQPKLLLADEPTSALDVTTQAQIVRQMMELRQRYHTSIILVTHNLGVAAYMADRILVMKNGLIVDEGTREQILRRPQDEYTRGLLAAVPVLEGEMYVS